jgi:hypothetical protein
MPEEKPQQIRAHCPICGPERVATIIRSHQVTDNDNPDGVWFNVTYNILECGGCKTVFFHEVSLCSEDVDEDNRLAPTHTYYPPPAKRKRPEWFSILDLDRGLYHLMSETYNALDVDARVLSATGARTVFDRASELLGVDPALSFEKKLDQLGADGHIGISEREYLEILTDAGGAAAHRGWIPTPEQLNTVMLIVEAFIHRKFILEAEVKKLKAQIPPRPKRTSSP